MDKKAIVSLGLVAGILTGVSQCNEIETPRAFAKELEITQTLSVGNRMNLIEVLSESRSFSRLEVSIKTTQPWLREDFQKMVLSDTDLISVLENAGFSGKGLQMAWAVVKLESTNRLYAHNQNSSTGDNSYGLFQINMIGSMGPARLKQHGLKTNEELFSPEVNSRVAYVISDGGSSWSAWTTSEKAKAMLNQFPG